MTRGADPYALGHRGGGHDGSGHDGGTHDRGGDGSTGHGEGGPASKRIITGHGFWIFLLSDIVMFSERPSGMPAIATTPPPVKTRPAATARSVEFRAIRSGLAYPRC
jgi:hypothetical protein